MTSELQVYIKLHISIVSLPGPISLVHLSISQIFQFSELKISPTGMAVLPTASSMEINLSILRALPSLYLFHLYHSALRALFWSLFGREELVSRRWDVNYFLPPSFSSLG